MLEWFYKNCLADTQKIKVYFSQIPVSRSQQIQINIFFLNRVMDLVIESQQIWGSAYPYSPPSQRYIWNNGGERRNFLMNENNEAISKYISLPISPSLTFSHQAIKMVRVQVVKVATLAASLMYSYLHVTCKFVYSCHLYARYCFISVRWNSVLVTNGC